MKYHKGVNDNDISVGWVEISNLRVSGKTLWRGKVNKSMLSSFSWDVLMVSTIHYLSDIMRTRHLGIWFKTKSSVRYDVHVQRSKVEKTHLKYI